MDEPRLGMIGAGAHATRNVYPCFPLLRNARVVANADLNEARAAGLADRYGISARYTDYRAMIEREKLDGVIICVGADFHARAAVEVMEKGCHVYVEKPPALDWAQYREVREVQRRTGKVCMTAFKKRYAPAYQKARAVIEGREFGAPALLTITRTSGQWPEGEDSINTYLRENSIHVLDLAAYLFGKVARVAAVARPVATAVIACEFAEGGIGSVAVTDRMSYARGWEVVTAVGSGGVCLQVDNSVEMNAYHFDQPLAAHKPEFVAGSSSSAVEQGFAGELQAFVEAIRTGVPPPGNSEDTAHVMAILQAVRESLSRGRAVEVKDDE